MIKPKNKIFAEFDRDYDCCSYSMPTLTSLPSTFSEAIDNDINEFIDEYELNVPLEDRTPNGSLIKTITSYTGDDAITAGLNRFVTVTKLVVPKTILNIKIAKPDTGISNKLGNYTEGWILYPPHKNASFDSVQRKYKGNAMGLAFDTLKLKQFLPNTKGNFNIAGLADKYKQANKQVEWVDELWIGHTFSQLMRIMMMTLFDFKNSQSFPFLYESEGGCGGGPPFDNLDTFVSAAHHFKGGKAKAGIAAIMSEAYLIQRGKLSPQKGIATQAMHFVQTGTKIENLYGLMKDPEYIKLSFREKEEIIETLSGKDAIPERLRDLSYEIEPDNKLVGSIISELRQHGFLMTELDVRLAMISRDRFKHLLGDIPMKEILYKMQKEKELQKKQAIKSLVELSAFGKTDIQTGYDLYAAGEDYFRMRKNRSDITGFSYSGRIRIFRTEDVKTELMVSNLGLQDEVVGSLATSNNYNEGHKMGHSKIKFDMSLDAIQNCTMDELFENPPPGVGPDDARIGLKALKLPEKVPLFVITDDEKMMDLLHHFKDNVFRISISEYHKAIAYKDSDLYMKQGIRVRLPDTGENSQNYVMTGEMRQFQTNAYKKNKVQICYDFNNINRRNEAAKGGKGYLKRGTAENLNYGELEWEEFKNISDFKFEIRPKLIYYGSRKW